MRLTTARVQIEVVEKAVAKGDVLLVSEFVGAAASDSGTEIKIEARIQNGKTVDLLFSPEHAYFLMSLLSAASGDAARNSSAEPGLKHVFPTDWWEFGLQQDQTVVLSFRLPGGMELAFHLHRNAAERMLQTMASLLGKAEANDPLQRALH